GVAATVVVVRDITERERRERELRESNQSLSAALATADLGIWKVNFVTREMSWDARMKALMGLAPEVELTWDEAMTFIHPDDLPLTTSILRRASEVRSEMQWEWRVGSRDSESRRQKSRGDGWSGPEC